MAQAIHALHNWKIYSAMYLYIIHRKLLGSYFFWDLFAGTTTLRRFT